MHALQAKILAPSIGTEFPLPQYAMLGKDIVIKLFETLLIPTGLSVYIGAPGGSASSSPIGRATFEMEHFQ